MRNFGNFAAFGVLRRIGWRRCELNFRAPQRPVKTSVVLRSVPTPPGLCPPGTRRSMSGNSSSRKYVLNPSSNRVESRSGDGGSTVQAYGGASLFPFNVNSRHGPCFFKVLKVRSNHSLA